MQALVDAEGRHGPVASPPPRQSRRGDFRVLIAPQDESGLDNLTDPGYGAEALPRGIDLIRRCGDAMAVYSGDDPTAMELMLAGARGNISVTANVAPALMAELCRLAIAGKRTEAEQVEARLAPLNSALFVEPNPIPVKWALARRQLIESGIRLPMTPWISAITTR